MNQNKHTPGPWKAQRDLYNTPYPEKGFGIYSEVTHLRVADLCPAMPTEGHDMDTQESNARLIAAAPDMLAALESLFENCSMIHNRWGDGSNQREADDAINAARAAIAKAKGEA